MEVIDVNLIISRLKSLKNFSTDTQLSNFLGVKSANLAQWKKRNSMNLVELDNILTRTKGISANWLLLGKGSEYLTDSIKTTNKANGNENQQIMGMNNVVSYNNKESVDALSEQLHVKDALIADLNEQIKTLHSILLHMSMKQ